jgi:hypothetical protein
MSRSKKRRSRSIAARQTNGVREDRDDGASLPTSVQPARGNGQVTPHPENQATDAPPSSLKEEVYLDERKLLVDLEQKSADQHDKGMLTLAAGGLALSITFLEKIAPKPLPDTLWLIACSWGGFITCLIAILGSFQTSQWACCRQRDILDRKLVETPGQHCDERNRWAKCTRWLNVTSYACFLAAVVFLAYFSWRNIPDGRATNLADQTNRVVENKNDRQKSGVSVMPPETPATPNSPTNENNPKPSDKNKQESL